MGKPNIRRLLGTALLRLFRVRVAIPNEARQKITRGRVVVCANHVSLLDGLLIALASPTPLTFGVDTDFSRRNPFTANGMAVLSRLGFGWVVPLDPSAPFGILRLKRALDAGRAVMLFPEGRISVDGLPQPLMPGLSWLIRTTGAEPVWVNIRGAEQSRLFAKSGSQIWPRIHLEFGNPA